jgi:hypothetical protein
MRLIRQYRSKLPNETVKIPRIPNNPAIISQCHHSMSGSFLSCVFRFSRSARFSPDNIPDQLDRLFHRAGDRLAQANPFFRFERFTSYDQYPSRRASE